MTAERDALAELVAGWRHGGETGQWKPFDEALAAARAALAAQPSVPIGWTDGTAATGHRVVVRLADGISFPVGTPLYAAQPNNDQPGGGATAPEQAKAEKAGVASGTPDPIAAPAQGEPMTAPPREPLTDYQTDSIAKGVGQRYRIEWQEVGPMIRDLVLAGYSYAQEPAAPAPPVAQPAEPPATNGPGREPIMDRDTPLPEVWVVWGKDGVDFVAPLDFMAQEHANEHAELFPEGGPWRVHKYTLAAPPVAQPAEPPAQGEPQDYDAPDAQKLGARLAVLLDADHWNEVEPYLLRLKQYETALAGLPAGALDGGWTAIGICSYAKSLEERNERQAREIAELQANFDGLDAASTDERRMTFDWRQRAERAEAECEKLRSQLKPEVVQEPRIDNSYTGQIARLKVECEKLRAQLAYIEQNMQSEPDMGGNHKWWRWNPRPFPRGPTFIAAIDAARAKVGP